MTLKLNHFGFISQLVCTTLMILGTLFIFSNNVSAVSDKVVNVDLSLWGQSQTLCNNTSECDTYKYVTVTLGSTSNTNFYDNDQIAISIRSETFCSIKFKFLKTMTCELVDGQSFKDSVAVFYGTQPNLTGYLVYTFSENPPAGGSTPCPEPEPCDCDTPPIVAFFRDVFLNVVTGVIPAFAVFVVVWFMVDMLSSLWFGRGK